MLFLMGGLMSYFWSKSKKKKKNRNLVQSWPLKTDHSSPSNSRKVKKIKINNNDWHRPKT
jgi:hypothetical protein